LFICGARTSGSQIANIQVEKMVARTAFQTKQRGISMAAMIKTAIPLFRQPQKKANSNSTLFVDEDLAAIPAVRIPDEFRKLSRFLPVIVLVPKSAVEDKIGQKKAVMKKTVAGLQDSGAVPVPLDAAKAWFRNPSPGDNFAFGEVTVSFSRMETQRKGQSVALTCKQFKTMAYLIKNAGKVISRDELLNEVWGYQCYPCTRTVDNHILQLRRKLETEPARPKHFQTVHGTGYRFLP
jgi:DNA-binding response OmpR family regulator